MRKKRIRQVIDALSDLVSISEEQKQEYIDKCMIMSDVDVIKELLQKTFILFSDNLDIQDYSIELIRSINTSICPSKEEIKERLIKMFSNEMSGNMSLEQNHRLLNESLINFTKLLNESGIDYYIVGALPCFLKTGQQLFRYHDDIDIMINEEDIELAKQVIESTGYIFYDDRYPNVERFHEIEKNKPPHTVLAQNPNNEFHLGFFCFRREPNNSMTIREYSHRLENGEVITDVLERRLTPLGTALRYEENKTNYNGTSFRCGSIEDVYNLKSYTRRPKDITDNKRLEPFIDNKKLELLKQNPLIKVEIKNEKLPEKQASI